MGKSNYEYEENIDGLISALLDGNEDAYYNMKNQLINNGFSVNPTPEKWTEISNKFLESGLSDEEVFSILDLFSKDSIVECLADNPDILGGLTYFRKLDVEHLEALLPQIANDKVVKFAICNEDMDFIFANTIMNSVHDTFLREKIRKAIAMRSKLEEYNLDDEINQIDRYVELRNEIIKCDDDSKKCSYLSNLESTDKDEVSIAALNSMIVSMLDYMEDTESRNLVVGNMKSVADPKIKSEIKSAKKEILSFFSAQGEIPQELREKIEIVFNSYSFQVDNLFARKEGKRTLGTTNSFKRQIKVDECMLGDRNMIISVLVHEIGHAICDTYSKDQKVDLTYSDSQLARDFEEGFVETFSQLVMADAGKETGYTEDYIDYTSIVKTMLIPLAKNGEDVVALEKYLAGDRKSCYSAFEMQDIFLNPNRELQIDEDIVECLNKKDIEPNESTKKVYITSNNVIDSTKFKSRSFTRGDAIFSFEQLYDLAHGNDISLDDIENIDDIFSEIERLELDDEEGEI